MRLFRIFKEIRNYFYIGGLIRKHKNTPGWNKAKLRVGYFNVIYTVINLPPEVFEAEEIYWQTYIIEQLKPINDYLAGLNLQEIVRLQVDKKISREDGTFAYLCRYIPLFRDFTFSWVISRSAIIALAWWLESRFSALSKIVPACKFIWDYFHHLFVK